MSSKITDNGRAEFPTCAQADWIVAYENYLTHGVPAPAEFPQQLSDEEKRRLVDVRRALDALHGAFVTHRTSSKHPEPPPQLGDYQILREIGRGGMGIVYEAEQLSMRRKVALKILPLAAMLDPKRLERFHNEVRAAAALDHPHCVPIYAVGEERGVHYYAMKLIRGQSLARVIEELRNRDALADRPTMRSSTPPSTNGHAAGLSSRDMAETTRALETNGANGSVIQTLSMSRSSRKRDYFRRIAELVSQAADALHHAHEQGVVHRDIKPGNLLLDSTGKLWVTDFGLARIEADAGLTMTGDFLGTLCYMAPEQATGKRPLMDHRVDVYSLGCTFYELLTLQPAFGGSDRAALLNKIASENPIPPRRIDPSIPVDLETIISTAMEKDPVDRYATAEELAADLRRFLENQPIRAEPPTFLERATKWCHRHSELSWAAAVMLLFATLVSTAAAVWISRLYRESEQFRKAAVAATGDALEQKAQLERNLYIADMNSAYQAWTERDLRKYESLLLRHRPKSDQERPGIEWRFLWRLGHPRVKVVDRTESPLYDICLSPAGDVYAVAGADGVVRVFGSDDDTLIDQFPTGQGEVNSVSFSPNGQLVATAGDDGTVKIWQWLQKEERLVINAHEDLAFAAIFHPDGKSLFTCGREPNIYMWDAETGEKLAALQGHSETVQQIRLSPTGKMLASGSYDGTVRIWDPDSLKVVHSIEVAAKVNCLAFASDGKRLYAGTVMGGVQGWNVETAEQVFAAESFDGIHSIAVSPSGREVAFGDYSGIVNVFYKSTNTFAARLHDDRVYSLRFSAAGDRLISCSADGRLKTCFYRRAQQSRTVEDMRVPYLKAVGEDLLAGYGKWGAYLIDPLSASVASALTPTERWEGLRSAVGQRRLVVAFRSNEIRLWDADTGEVVHRWQLPSHVRSVAISGSANLVAAAESEERLVVFDSQSGERIHSFTIPTRNANVRFSRNERLLAHSNDAQVTLLDLQTGRNVLTLEGALDGYAIDFSPDGATLATAIDRTIRIWDIESGSLQAAWEGHQAPIRGIRFLSQERTIVSFDETGFAIWDVETGQQYYFHRLGKSRHDLLYLSKPDFKEMYSLAISPDENWIAVSSAGQHGRILDLDVADAWQDN
jgi:WD40 repeat protein/serine/threonine protein kinase